MVMPRQVPTIQRVQKVEEVPQVECSDMVVDVPVMMQRQVSTTQLVQKTREVSQTQHTDKVAEIPVMMQRQIPMSAKVQKTVEMPQVQYIDEAVDNTGSYRSNFAEKRGSAAGSVPSQAHRCASCVETPRNNHPDQSENVERYSDVVFRSRSRRTGCGAATDASVSEGAKED